MFEYVQAHWTELLALVVSLVAVAGHVVKLTPTKTDDELYQSVIDKLTALGVLKPEAPAEAPKAAEKPKA